MGASNFWGVLYHQVKIRGHRIELGEIETALARHPMVAEAIVNVQHSSVGDRLIAYVVAIDQHALPTSQDLSDELRKLLPGYMVPDAFVNLSALPLTAHGKINRNALPAPELMPTVAFVAARNSQTRRLYHGSGLKFFGLNELEYTIIFLNSAAIHYWPLSLLRASGPNSR